jgi:hypothetical protein
LVSTRVVLIRPKRALRHYKRTTDFLIAVEQAKFDKI